MTASSRLRILVVDDDVSVADTSSLVLRHAGFQVTTFYDPLLAAQHALEFEPHAVITDYSMPNMNGLELAAWLHQHCPDCKIVIISGEAAAVAERVNDGLKFTLLQKPVDPRALIAAVHACRN
jgi:DNA-binding response OmpR family regulator